MKKNIHPDYHSIIMVMVDGREIPTRSTWGKKGDRLILDNDPSTHIAWTGEQHTNMNTGQSAKFFGRFGALKF